MLGDLLGGEGDTEIFLRASELFDLGGGVLGVSALLEDKGGECAGMVLWALPSLASTVS